MRIKPVSAGIAGLLLVLIVVGILALVSIFRPQPSIQGTTSTSGVSGSTTLGAIIAGTYPTATDKNGTGGVTVTVKNLQVLYVRPESDGDWHVAVTDGTFSVFITEITPLYQSSEGMPPVGSTIDETGIVYCDTFHQTETWHGSTCWEIHPVLSWHLSGTSVATTTTTTAGQARNLGVNATFTYAQNPIPRGTVQTITIQAHDSDGPIQNATVYVHILYASGSATYDFTRVTTNDGSCSVSWQIMDNSTPGTFMVTATINGQEFDSSFEVTAV
ncbi:MAG TPA: hypothetical protein VGR56_03890 [Nitrososphaerales archaeon]|nr:hypothetical protein [Nitrososphaerales archaeon]